MSSYDNLPAAKNRLEKAIIGLFDPITTRINGTTYEANSLYHQLLDAKAGQTGERCGGTAGMPLWPDAADLQVRIDSRIAEWTAGKGFDTIDRIHLIDVRAWKVEDTKTVETYAAELEEWAVAVDNLLNPKSVKTISAPCPHCRATHVYRMSAGERVRQAALQVVADVGCSCLSCNASWPPSRYDFLRRLLGLKPPEGCTDE